MTPCIDHGLKGTAQGYGRYWSAELGKKELAHCQTFRRAHGYLPPVVMHTCDNPRCINVDHLQAGDWDSNNKDRASKQRSAKAVPSRRKIDDTQAAEIRRRWALKVGKIDKVNGVMAIARDFEVDPVVVYNIVKWRTHFHVSN